MPAFLRTFGHSGPAKFGPARCVHRRPSMSSDDERLGDDTTVHLPARARVGQRLRVMTYNVHACLGRRNRPTVDGIVSILKRAAPDVIAMQELDVDRPRSGFQHQARAIAERLRYHFHFTPTLEREGGQYGIGLLSAQPTELVSELMLPARRDEQRAAQLLRARVEGHTLTLLHTHLSVRPLERRLQLSALLNTPWLGEPARRSHLIVCGDLNATPGSPVYRALAERLRDVQGPGSRTFRPQATWPANLPLLRLDHIFVGSAFEVSAALVPRWAPLQHSSDHLPLIADLRMKDAAFTGSH